jgi:hypothetical protein
MEGSLFNETDIKPTENRQESDGEEEGRDTHQGGEGTKRSPGEKREEHGWVAQTMWNRAIHLSKIGLDSAPSPARHLSKGDEVVYG